MSGGCITGPPATATLGALRAVTHGARPHPAPGSCILLCSMPIKAHFYVCSCTAPARSSTSKQAQIQLGTPQSVGKTALGHTAVAAPAAAGGPLGPQTAPGSALGTLRPGCPTALTAHSPCPCAISSPCSCPSGATSPWKSWQRAFYWHLRLVPATVEPAAPGQGGSRVGAHRSHQQCRGQGAGATELHPAWRGAAPAPSPHPARTAKVSERIAVPGGSCHLPPCHRSTSALSSPVPRCNTAPGDRSGQQYQQHPSHAGAARSFTHLWCRCRMLSVAPRALMGRAWRGPVPVPPSPAAGQARWRGCARGAAGGFCG